MYPVKASGENQYGQFLSSRCSVYELSFSLWGPSVQTKHSSGHTHSDILLLSKAHTLRIFPFSLRRGWSWDEGRRYDRETSHTLLILQEKKRKERKKRQPKQCLSLHWPDILHLFMLNGAFYCLVKSSLYIQNNREVSCQYLSTNHWLISFTHSVIVHSGKHRSCCTDPEELCADRKKLSSRISFLRNVFDFKSCICAFFFTSATSFQNKNWNDVKQVIHGL